MPAALGAPLAALPRFRAALGEIDAELSAAEDVVAALATRHVGGEAGFGPRAAGAKLVSEIRPASGPVIDPAFLTRFARAHEDGGFDRVLIGYGSGDPEAPRWRPTLRHTPSGSGC